LFSRRRKFPDDWRPDIRYSIDEKYDNYGRERGPIGRPTSDGGLCADGLGRFRHYRFEAVQEAAPREVRPDYPDRARGRSVHENPFRNVVIRRESYDSSLYWSPATGAQEVHGTIRDAWAKLGWESGVLGYPITDEELTPDGRGRYNEFEHGAIYWSPKTGAHEVHGDIYNLWAELGWEESRLGFPTSDVMPTPDAQGLRASFENGEIWWNQNEGARIVTR
jgi:uncharacterized protein with LGFP repeats